ncbi:TlpA family protein disulfide reductase [Streptomyces fragilis]|uniref:TlpA disulfide reductase family protein n=1 Tax=Streptomyces fragilis TaxID=67301 RepID=A0ABV2YD33_9ACTN|nr:TlpA disulfide reductase family protein [Streptomyces fragilis]
MPLKIAARAVALTSVFVVTAAALSACGDGGTPDRAGTSFVSGEEGIQTIPKENRKSVGKIKGETLHGDSLDLSSYRGKIVVINAWGSWCAPCRAEAPYLNEVAKELKGDGVAFVGINTRDADKRLPQAFEKDYSITYPSLYDPTGRIILSGFPKGTLSLQGVPSTVVLDREGKIAARAFGEVNYSRLHKMIDPVLAEK